MSTAEQIHYSATLSKRHGDMGGISEIELMAMGSQLKTPTQTVIEYTEKLLSHAQQNPAWEDFVPDLQKMLKAANQLLILLNKLFDKDSYPGGEIDFAAFGSSVRHDLRTPINAVIGYGEMILEDIEGENDTESYQDLQKILNLARKLLNLINDLSYIGKSNTSSSLASSAQHAPSTEQTLAEVPSPPAELETPVEASLPPAEYESDEISESSESSEEAVISSTDSESSVSTDVLSKQELAEVGEALRTTTQDVLDYTQILLDYALHQQGWEDFTPDLNKMSAAANQLLGLISRLFDSNNYPNGQIELNAFSATVRHDLRTPINALIGYSEMILEELEGDSQYQESRQNLQKIQGSARKLLNAIDDLGYLKKPLLNRSELPTDKKSATEPKSTTSPLISTPTPKTSQTSPVVEEELVDMGHDLITPANTIISYTEMLLKYAQHDETYSGLTNDLHRMLASGEQLASFITQLFAKKNHPEGKIDPTSFTPKMRHDLRTPINAVIGYSEMLTEDLDPKTQQSIIVDLEKILGAARRLLTLIDDLSYLFKSEKNGSENYIAEMSGADQSASTLMDEVVRTMHDEDKYIESRVELEPKEANLLVVDDKESNRDLLSRRLDRQGFTVEVAENGRQALEMVRTRNYDLVLLDIIMPELNGFQVLAEIKKNEKLRHIPVIMISALDEIDSVVRCIEMGAEDYLQKPFNQVILKAKISASLERKRLRDREHAFITKLQIEQEKSEKLLLNILPKPIADRLKRGAKTIADSFPEVTVLFSDLVGFTELSTSISPSELVEKLNEIFLAFDILTELHGLEKIKTIGDAYMLVGGLPTPRPDHVESVAEMAIDMFDAIERINGQSKGSFNIRVGIHTGPVVAGVIGKNKFNYDLWGDAVNVASRMESHGLPGHIQISEASYKHIKDKFIFERRGPIEIKGKGEMVTYFLKGRK